MEDGVRKYTYDGENRLISVTQGGSSWAYRYDYLGRRFEKSGTGIATTRFVYDGWNVIAELDGDGSVTRTFVWGLDVSGTLQGAGGVGGLLQIRAGSASYYPIYDASHNVAGLYDGSGTLAAAYDYDPFGRLLDPFGRPQTSAGSYAAANPFRSATKYTDDETGLVSYGLRYYNPSLGRFINRDPIEEAGGLNLYAFCGNDGVNRFDLLGMTGEDDDPPITLPPFVVETTRDRSQETLDREQLNQSIQDVNAPNSLAGAINGGLQLASIGDGRYSDGTTPWLSPGGEAGAAGKGLQHLAVPDGVTRNDYTFPRMGTGDIRSPDFVALNINVGPLVAWSGTLSRDRYGDWFWSPLGASVGKSPTMVSGSLTMNWLNQSSTPSPSQLDQFLSGHGTNFTGGAGLGFSESYTPGSGTATGVGFVTPQLGGGYNYSFPIK